MPGSPDLHLGPSDSGRRAAIVVEQLPNGYWRGGVEIQVPGLPTHIQIEDAFHDAGAALDWARSTIESFVAAVA